MSPTARYGATIALVIGLFSLAACGHRPPSSEYLAAVTQIQNRIDQYRGAQSSTTDIPSRLQSLIDSEPGQPHAYAEAAHFLIFIGSTTAWPGRGKTNAEAAESLLADAKKADAGYCATYWLLAQLNVAMKRPDAALTAADSGAAQHCEDPWLHVTRGRASMAKAESDADDIAKSDIQSADSEFRKAIDAGPGATSHSRSAYAAACFDYGMLLYRTGRHEELRGHLARWEADGLVFDPWAQINIAYLHDMIGQFDHAQTAAESALAVLDLPAARNAMALALYGQAWALEAQGRSNDRATQTLTKAAQSYMPDETTALNTFTGAACCVSEAWRRVLEQHRQAHADAPQASSPH